MSTYIEGIFLRYSDSGNLIITPDIKAKVAELIPLLEANTDHKAVFKEVIKSIPANNGAGVDPASTWFAAVKELFGTYERYDGNPLQGTTKQALIGLLKILVSGGVDERIDWDKIRTYLIDNIKVLSPMPDRYLTTFDGKEVMRDEHGTYYHEDDEYGTVIVHGLKTPPEEMLQFYTNDTQMKFGRLYRILRFISLFDIAYEYTHFRSDFPDQLSCTLYDNGGETNYLSWQWQMPTPFDFVPFQWHPRSAFSNPDWLSSDLVTRLPFPNANAGAPILPIPPTNESLQLWNDTFSGYRWQLEVPIASSVTLPIY